jgi:YggT family protein
MGNFVGSVIMIYIIILFVRVILSWFPVRSGTFAAQLNSLAFELTEPVLRPLRRIIPPVGMFDLSVTILIIFLFLLRSWAMS